MKAEITNIVKRNDNEITVFYKITEENGHIIEENAHFPFPIDNIDNETVRNYMSNRLEQIRNKPELPIYEELIGEVIE